MPGISRQVAGERPWTGPPGTWLRRWLFWLTAGTMVGLEVAFGLCALGAPLSPPLAIAGLAVCLPLVLATGGVLLERGREAAREPEAWWRWTLCGAGVYLVWAVVYFAIGKLVDPSRVHLLRSPLEARIPLLPSFSLLYVLLYPMYLFPFFVVRDKAVLIRLLVADILMLPICSVLFIAVPVSFERVTTLPVTDLGSWLLSVVWSADVTWNCMPSEHCMAAMIATLAIIESKRNVGYFALFTTILIGLSTLFTKQHYLVDVLAGYAGAVAIYAALKRLPRFAAAPVRRPMEQIGDR